ncbi:MAG: ribonuclease HII [Clostridia bacterium]|nr:ribonuclease HII [Clostridia bacterium]
MPKKKEENIDKLYYEKQYLLQGCRCIVGVDEVGRGPLAGPVVAAAVIMPLQDGEIIEGVDDSKKVSPKKRELIAEKIKEKAIAYSVIRIEPNVIDEINILQATRLAMKKAIESLPVTADMVLTDGNMTLDITAPQQSIVKGDALSYSIGAASILAKVYRDNVMKEYAEEYPYYAFEKNMGYGTAAHIQGIKEHGLCPIHRRTFTKKL